MATYKIQSKGLSKSWEVEKKHKGAYSGGKFEMAQNEQFIACMYSEDISFLDVNTGEVTSTLQQDVDVRCVHGATL